MNTIGVTPFENKSTLFADVDVCFFISLGNLLRLFRPSGIDLTHLETPGDISPRFKALDAILIDQDAAIRDAEDAVFGGGVGGFPVSIGFGFKTWEL